jgi:hypothetical protein
MRSAVRTPRRNRSPILELVSVIGRLTEEKRRRISSAGGDRGDEGNRDADHLTHQFLIGNQQYDINNISRRDGATVGRNK